MNKKKVTNILAALALLVMVATSLISIALDDGGQPYPYATLRDEVVEIYGGEGVYQFDTIFKAVMFRGFDWANLFVAAPILIWAIVLYRRDQFKGKLLITAVFAYLVYIYLIGVMGNAFNMMFLFWTALFALGFFGLTLILPQIDLRSFPEHSKDGFPRKGLLIYMLFVGLFLSYQYLSEIFSAYAAGLPPTSLAHYTTLELAAMEVGIMIPLHFIAGVLLWKKNAIGSLLAGVLVFASLMTFTALAIANLVLYMNYEIGVVMDFAVPIILTMIVLLLVVSIVRHVDSDQG